MKTLIVLSALLMSCTSSPLFLYKFSQATPNIPQLVKSLGLTTLFNAVVKEKLADLLSSPGPFTVFGPTNEAFANLPDWAKNITQDDRILTEILKYHVLPGKVLSTAITDNLLAKTAEGDDIRFKIYPNGVITAQCAPIAQVDKEASNGVVHILKSVMIPPAGNMVKALSGCPAFTTLVTAVQAAGLVEGLSGPGPFTLFAPTNDAFAKLPPGALDNLLSNKTALANVLEYHVVPGTFCSAGLTDTSVTSLNGKTVDITVSGGGVMVNNAHVIAADGSITNGVIHGIDAVLGVNM